MKAYKKALITAAGAVTALGVIASGALSRSVYSIWDIFRTNEILDRFNNANNGEEEKPVSNFRKQAFLNIQNKSEEGKRTKIYDVLAFTSESTYELTHYEEVTTQTTSYSADYFHMSGDYTRSKNIVTVTPGIGVYSVNPTGSGFTHYNAQYVTSEDAAGGKTRDEIYDMKYLSRSFALMADGSFTCGGTSDASTVIEAPEDVKVYSTKTTQGRITMQTLITMPDGNYILYSQATNSNNHEQTTGCFFGSSSYVINDNEKAIAPDEEKPEETYAIVRGTLGTGYMYANNNGSHMQFDLRNEGQFKQWLNTSFNAPTPTFFATESGFTIKIGALKTQVGKWGLYVPAGDIGGGEEEPEPTDDIHLEVATTVEGKPFILDLNADGTMKTGWTNYAQTVKEGTWSVFGKTIILNVGYPYAIEYKADGSVEITVDYGPMGSKTFAMNAENYNKVKASASSIKLEVATTVEGKPFIVEFNADGTVATGWTNYAQTVKEGTWEIDAEGNLVISVEGYTFTLGNTDENGNVTFSIDYVAMGVKEYALSKVQLDALKAEAPIKGIHLEVATTVEGKPFILDLNDDGTMKTGWTNYSQTVKEGTWSVFGKTLILDAGYAYSVSEGENGSLVVTIDYVAMGSKTYTLSAEQVEFINNHASNIRLEVETTVESKPFIVEFNADGTLSTGWTNYAQTVKEGTWEIDAEGNLVISVEGYTYTLGDVDANGNVAFSIDYVAMGVKEYTLSKVQLDALKAEAKITSVHAEVATTVEGKPFILDLNDDGTVTTGWTNYAAAVRTGTWSTFNGKLVIDVNGFKVVATTNNEDGTTTISVDYGQMGVKEYVLSEDEMAFVNAHTMKIEHEVETNVEGKPFILNLNEDGTLSAGWTNYEQTICGGSWKVIKGSLILEFANPTYSATVSEEEGKYVIDVLYGQMGVKHYELSVLETNALKANETASIKLEVASSAEGKPFVLEINNDGTCSAYLANYYTQTLKTGTWEVVENELVFTIEGYTVEVAHEDGNVSLKVDFGQMGVKSFAVPTSIYEALLK